MSMFGHYTKLFEEIGCLEVRPAIPEQDFPEHLPSTNALAFYQDPNTNDGILWDYWITKRNPSCPKGVIHVGAHDLAERMCYVPMFGENVIWFEANAQSYNKWAHPIAQYFGQYAFPFAASDETGECDYYQNHSNDTSGLLPINQISGNNAVTKVKQKRLDDVIDEYDINMANFDFLNIDVEGAELKVLKGIEKNLHHINYLFMEVSVTERNTGQVIFEDLNDYVNEKGFKMVKVSDSINTLGWGDAFYVRD